MNLVLGIETSCDETAAAVVADGGRILSNIVSSQIELHKPYGGVVPEIASRNHLQLIDAVIEDALQQAGVSCEQLDAVAATYGPGLAGSLLVGLTSAKAMAFALDVPFIGINHLEAHLFSPFLSLEGGWRDCEPFVSLIVSGGHTILTLVRDVDNFEVLGETVDDAAGEAFDKVAKLLGLSYPGGPEIDRLARNGNPKAVNFPRSMLEDSSLNFSFSGIKTAALYHLRGVPESRQSDRPRSTFASASDTKSLVRMDAQTLADFCASFQEAIVDVLVGKTIRAARANNTRFVCVSGGVACNSRLRKNLATACRANNLQLLIAHPRLCTDNGAMIAALALLKLARGHSELSLDIAPSLSLGGRAESLH